MQDKIKISLETGFKVDIVHPSETGIDIIETPMTQSFHKPKWTGIVQTDDEGNEFMGEGEWVEGATQEEIDELTKPTKIEPSQDDRIKELENTILMLLMMQ